MNVCHTAGGGAINPFIVALSLDLLLVQFHDECSVLTFNCLNVQPHPYNYKQDNNEYNMPVLNLLGEVGII